MNKTVCYILRHPLDTLHTVRAVILVWREEGPPVQFILAHPTEMIRATVQMTRDYALRRILALIPR